MNPRDMIEQVVANSSATAALIGTDSSGGGLLGNLTPGSIFVMVMLSLVGFVYFRYGKTQQDIASIVCGIALIGFPYLVSDTLYMTIIGIAIIVVHFFIKKWM
ncbi:MAG: hypothetical protein PHW69_01665 [Elusimicrobiaceae bacterium]|nr:hypothetical protein [Elusimicrobiaceae bacterium]